MKQISSVFCVILVCSLFGPLAHAKQGLVEGGPESLDKLSSLEDAIIHSDKNPLHIIYIHGIGSEGTPDSIKLQQAICKRVTDCTNQQFLPASREWADTGIFSPDTLPGYQYMGVNIWTSKKEWIASAPFVDHYIIKRNRGKKDIFVDEINWWPIVFPIKCRNIMAKEASLAGLAEKYRKDCSRETKLDIDGEHYLQFNWLGDQGTRRCWPKPPLAAVANNALKNFPIDWGFGDAMLAVGPLHDLFMEAIRQLYVKSVSFKPDGAKYEGWLKEKSDDEADQEQFVFVTHSLGSYLALSTLGLDHIQRGRLLETEDENQRANKATEYIFKRTSLIYFFANQISLLELANIRPAINGEDVERMNTLNSIQDMEQHIHEWAKLRKDFTDSKVTSGDCPSKPQIVAWSDPGDLLTFSVPQLDDALVSNLYVVNSCRICFLFLLECPIGAHDNYDANKHVLHVMMTPTKHSCVVTSKTLQQSEPPTNAKATERETNIKELVP